MAISYYFDAPVHRAIKLGLQLRGVEVLTAQDDQNSSADESGEDYLYPNAYFMPIELSPPLQKVLEMS